MPQMSPLMWLLLMFMIIFAYLLFLVVNYYIYQVLGKSRDGVESYFNQKNWRW